MNSLTFNYFLKFSLLIGILINLIVPKILNNFATPEQIKPPNGAIKLNLFDQIMHMFVHHNQVPFSSSIIISIIIGLSLLLSKLILDNSMIPNKILRYF
jgi:hypothetical protein